MTEAMRPEIWIFRIGSLGDALVALPAIHQIRALHPEAELVLLTNRSHGDVVNAGDVLRHAGVFSRVVAYREGSRIDLLRLVVRWRLRRPAAMYCLPPHRTETQRARDLLFFQRLGGIRTLLGASRAAPWAERGQPMQLAERESQRLLDAVAPGLDVDDVAAKPLLAIPQTSRARAAQWLAAGGWRPGTSLFAMVVGSKMPAKRWPLERFIAVARRLAQGQPSTRVVLLGSADEAALCAQATSLLPEVFIDLAGKTSLMDAAAVLEHCTCCIGNDTGTMHLAAAVHLPCVAVFSARDLPGKWTPYGRHHRVLRADVPCAGCMLEVCDRDLVCLTRIGVEQVLAAVAEVGTLAARGVRARVLSERETPELDP